MNNFLGAWENVNLLYISLKIKFRVNENIFQRKYTFGEREKQSRQEALQGD